MYFVAHSTLVAKQLAVCEAYTDFLVTRYPDMDRLLRLLLEYPEDIITTSLPCALQELHWMILMRDRGVTFKDERIGEPSGSGLLTQIPVVLPIERVGVSRAA